METSLVLNTVVLLLSSPSSRRWPIPRWHVHHRDLTASVHSKSSFAHLESQQVEEELKSDKTYGSSVPSEKALAHSLEKPRDSPGDVGASADMEDKVSVGNARLKMYDREDSLVSAN